MVREMYGHDVYLRGFRQEPVSEIVVDLGANRGLFEPIAVKVLGARKILAVEPIEEFKPAARLLLDSNGIRANLVERITGFIGVENDDTHIGFASILTRYGINRVHFCKMDIEGAEFQLVTSGDFLSRIDVLAAEVHPEYGDPATLAAALIGEGLSFRFTDQFGAACPPKAANYLYAARDPRLINW
jgi:hypothetical protein